MNRELIAHTPLGEAWWAVSITGHEALGELYEFRVGLVSDDPDIDTQSLLGEVAAVELIAQGGRSRYFSGHIVKVSALGLSGRHWAYEVTLAPKLWHATRRSDYRIWQQQSVREIANQVLQANALRCEWRLKNACKTWEYLVQYGETDFAFLSRLFEHEGIYYWFEHRLDGEKMILVDHFSIHEAFDGYEQIPFYTPNSGWVSDEEHYDDWCASREPEPGRFKHTDYDFQHPSQDLTTEYSDPRGHLFDQYEIYAYPGGYTETSDGRAYAATRLEALQKEQDVTELGGPVRGAMPGYRFTLYNHPRADQNRDYLITRARYEVRINDYETTPDADEQTCRMRIGAIPADRQFRPGTWTPKPCVRGPETAVVVGPGGSEIHTDKYGRVKVHFPWDRYGARDGSDTCWIRVSTTWAGKGFGAVSIPRVGHEVIIDYEHGDPDRPIIIGQVYNAETMPPWELPSGKVHSGLMSRSTPGGSEGNTLRFDDTSGAEQFMMHAQYNMDTNVNNDESHTVGANRTTSITDDETCAVEGKRDTTVTGDETLTCSANRDKTVVGDETCSTTKTRTTNVTGNETLICAADRQKTIDGDESNNFVGNREKKVGGSEGVEIGEDSSIFSGPLTYKVLGGLRQEDVGGGHQVGVDENMTTKAANYTVTATSHSVTAKTAVTVNASVITLKAGPALIRMDNSGITIVGLMEDGEAMGARNFLSSLESAISKSNDVQSSVNSVN
ncbi:MAG: type VI secretion system tip protein VgrG [Betaproteobacteria bacterium]|nr:type VI secretion system tip protein VgrG [Betaproteobacteria bacterium]